MDTTLELAMCVIPPEKFSWSSGGFRSPPTAERAGTGPVSTAAQTENPPPCGMRYIIPQARESCKREFGCFYAAFENGMAVHLAMNAVMCYDIKQKVGRVCFAIAYTPI